MLVIDNVDTVNVEIFNLDTEIWIKQYTKWSHRRRTMLVVDNMKTGDTHTGNVEKDNLDSM